MLNEAVFAGSSTIRWSSAKTNARQASTGWFRGQTLISIHLHDSRDEAWVGQKHKLLTDFECESKNVLKNTDKPGSFMQQDAVLVWCWVVL